MRVGGICGQCNKYYDGEFCPKCDDVSSGKTINIIMDIQPHYNRGLGEYVSSRSEYRALCRQKGLIEVGNEKNYITKEYEEKQRAKVEDQQYKQIRPEAYRMLSHLENKGVPEWN